MISVVIPAYNEEGAIRQTIEEIHKTFGAKGMGEYEIVVVNDGSTDNTMKVAKKAKARVVNHPQPAGYGRALKDGILAAKYDTIVTTDADLTYPFECVPALHDEYEKGFDMVVGRRVGPHVNESLIKSPLRRILRFLVEFTAGKQVPDVNSGLRIFSKKAVTPYFGHLCDTFSFSTSLTLAYMMTGTYVGYADIPYQKREGNTKVKVFRDSLRTLQFILQAINYYNPIKIFILFAAMCVLFGLTGFVFSALAGINAGYYLGIGGFLMALIVLCMGLLADLLKQIMMK